MLHTSQRERLKHLIELYSTAPLLFKHTVLGKELHELILTCSNNSLDKSIIRDAVMYEVRHSFISVNVVDSCISHLLY